MTGAAASRSWIAAAALLVAGVTSAAADQEAAKAEPEAWQEEVLSGFDFDATLGASVGFDSNPAGDADGEGTFFNRLDLTQSLVLGEDGETQAFVDFEGNLIRYFGGPREVDHEYSARLEVYRPLTDNVSLSVGVLHQKDATDDPASALTELWTSVAADLDVVRWDARLAVGDDRDFVDSREIRLFDLEVFDHVYGTGEIRTEIDTDSRFAPVLETRLTALDYQVPRPGKPDRDATEYSLMAGMEIDAPRDLRFQIAARRNERFFDDRRFEAYDSTGLDLEAGWTPDNDVTFEASYERSLDEPLSEEGSVLDVAETTLEIYYPITDRVNLRAEATHTTEKEIGTEYRLAEIEAEAELRWSLRDNLAVLLAGEAGREVVDDATGSETTDRGIIRAGLEATF